MRTFQLIRYKDLTGVSGIGVVAVGKVLKNGQCVLKWISKAKLADGSVRTIKTLTLHECWENVVLLHGHNGATVLKWDDTLETISDIQLLNDMTNRVNAKSVKIRQLRGL
jgi:hypothetical protein